MGEFSLRTLVDVSFELGPSSFVIPDLLAGGTDRQHPCKGLHLSQGVLELGDQPLAFRLCSLGFRDVADRARNQGALSALHRTETDLERKFASVFAPPEQFQTS